MLILMFSRHHGACQSKFENFKSSRCVKSYDEFSKKRGKLKGFEILLNMKRLNWGGRASERDKLVFQVFLNEGEQEGGKGNVIVNRGIQVRA